MSTPEFEERQMQQWEEMYRILFEHPLVEAVTGWDFTDGITKIPLKLTADSADAITSVCFD